MICQLSDEVQCHLRSGVAITSLTQCVEELVMNALDAGASCIAVRVDLPCFKIQTVDNGQGISRDQLEKVGERYGLMDYILVSTDTLTIYSLLHRNQKLYKHFPLVKFVITICKDFFWGGKVNSGIIK